MFDVVFDIVFDVVFDAYCFVFVFEGVGSKESHARWREVGPPIHHDDKVDSDQ